MNPMQRMWSGNEWSQSKILLQKIMIIRLCIQCMLINLTNHSKSMLIRESEAFIWTGGCCAPGPELDLQLSAHWLLVMTCFHSLGMILGGPWPPIHAAKRDTGSRGNSGIWWSIHYLCREPFLSARKVMHCLCCTTLRPARSKSRAQQRNSTWVRKRFSTIQTAVPSRSSGYIGCPYRPLRSIRSTFAREYVETPSHSSLVKIYVCLHALGPRTC